MHAVASAYADVGMRAVIAPMVADRSLFEAIPGLLDALPLSHRASIEAVRLAPARTIIEACSNVFAGWKHNRDFVRPALAPTIPLHCSQPFLEACRDLARSFDIGLHTHLAESRVQAVAGLDAYGKTLTAYLDELGLLGPDLTAAHCVWLDDDDIARLADRGCSVAHNPGSNLRLGSGIAPVRRMLNRGVNVGLGTDGSHCSDNQNMFEAMRLASFISRVADVDPDHWISTDEAAMMSTGGSAKALGFGDRIGHLEVGRQADIVLLDLANINFVPFNDPTNQLVHSEDSSAVRDVMIGGKWVLRNGEFLTFDFGRLRTKVEDTIQRMRSMSPDLKRTADQLAQYVSGFCIGSHSRPYHINRLCGCGPAAGFSASKAP
jgi:cytosine/adenosine deaminase-related metal-dependent hydrolase